MAEISRNHSQQTIVIPTIVAATHKRGNIHVLVVAGPLQGHEFEFEQDVFTIGSGLSNDLSIADTTMSKRHCEVYRRNGSIFIHDLGSTNGTSIEGIKVTEAKLMPNTEVQLGKTRVILPLEQAKQELQISPREKFGNTIGRTAVMRHVFYLAERATEVDTPILIVGEIGTGKEALARDIHAESARKNQPFIVIDCSGGEDERICKELFGTEGQPGALSLAIGGTLFIDALEQLPPTSQALLLRELDKTLNVRFICTLTKDANDDILTNKIKGLREDLYYRLSIISIEIPALRRRKDDIILLIQSLCARLKITPLIRDWVEQDGTISAFKRYDWPGNVMELRNILERANFNGVVPNDLSAFIKTNSATESSTSCFVVSSDRPFKDAKNDLIEEFERQYLSDLLARNSQNISKSARTAGIERAYLQRLIRKYGMRDESN